MTKNFFLIVLGLIMLIACESDEERLLKKLPDFWADHSLNDRDSASTANELLGTWKWVYYGTSSEFRNTEDQGLYLILEPEILYLIRQDTIERESTWSVFLKHGNYYALATVPFISQTSGIILFSDNMVLFNNAYIDGANHYFRKIE